MTKPIKLGYARVSTTNQSTAVQVEQLKAAGCVELFVDEAVSGAKNDQSPNYKALFARVEELRNEGKAVSVVVVKLDRFSRSLMALLEGIQKLDELGASFEALDGFKYEVGSHISKMVLQILGVIAEFERDLIKSRMNDGMEAAVAKGLIRGRKPTLSKQNVKSIRSDYEAGAKTVRELATEWSVSRSTIIRVVGLYGSKPYLTSDEWVAHRDKAAK